VQQPSLFEPFVVRLERLGLPYFVTGSTAAIIYGEPRLTHDVDIVVALSPRDVHAFVEAFPLEEFYCPPEDVLAIEVRRGQRGHCNLIHHDTGFKPTSISPLMSCTAGHSPIDGRSRSTD